MAHAFVSYCHEDKDLVAAFVKELEKRGVKVWWDEHILAGQQLRDLIDDHLESAVCIIVVWSPSSIKSNFVRDEAEKGRAEGKLVSVKTSDLAPNRLPPGFGSYRTSDIDKVDEVMLSLNRFDWKGSPERHVETGDKNTTGDVVDVSQPIIPDQKPRNSARQHLHRKKSRGRKPPYLTGKKPLIITLGVAAAVGLSITIPHDIAMVLVFAGLIGVVSFTAFS